MGLVLRQRVPGSILLPVALWQIAAFRYFFHSNEGDPRETVHIHVRGGGGEAKIVLYPVPRVVRSAGLDSGILRALTQVVEQNLDTIQEAWDDHFS